MEIIIDKDNIKKNPYKYYFCENILNKEYALNIQNEILNIDKNEWDRYNNPFEQKYTLRDKYNFPPKSKELFNYLESDKFINYLSEIVGIKLIKDEYRHFWGIHKYDNGDYLDIHVDAGIHPINKLKKQITLGIYFSKDWTEENKGHLEIWKGTNSSNNNAIITECIEKILPKFNTLVFFECDDYSWHGNPSKVNIINDEKRIFITISYLSENFVDLNKREKAFFVPKPDDEYNENKDKLRFLRADSKKYINMYRL